MDITPHTILTMEPRLMRARNGWLALSYPEAPLQIGVIGQTEEEAVERFDVARKAWARLRALPDQSTSEFDAGTPHLA